MLVALLLQMPRLVEQLLPQSGLLANFQADSGVLVDAAGQVIEWADVTGKHKALPNNTATANRQQRALNAANDQTFLTEHGHGLSSASCAMRHAPRATRTLLLLSCCGANSKS